MNPHFAQRRRMLAALPALLCTPALHAQARTFPAKPIQIIVPFPPGNATDALLRLAARHVQQALGQSVVVQNLSGAGGTLGPSSMVATAKPDGYTICAIAASVFRLPWLQKLPYDPQKDFSFIMGLFNYHFGIVVRADSPFQTVQDVLAAARGGQVTWGGIGKNTTGHIGVLLLARQAGFALNYVPYRGGADLVTSVLGGHVDVMGDAGWGPLLESGKLRLLALMGESDPRYAGVPTLRELGFDVQTDSPVALAAPAGLPADVGKILHDAFHEASRDKQFQDALQLHALRYDYRSTADYTQWAQRQIVLEKQRVQELGLKA